MLEVAGSTLEHGRIAANVGGEVGNRLKGRPCGVLDSSVQIRLGSSGRHAHPDVTVVRDPVQMDVDTPIGPVLVNPRLVFEVLSPTTENYDRTRKADRYREIESLQEYVFVWQDQPRVETYYRNVDGVWSIGGAATDLAGPVRLRSIDVDLPLGEVYARMAFPPPTLDG